MVRAEIIAIGSELVLGGVADTNSLYLAEELLKLGIEVRYKTVVGDDSKDMEAALQHALGRADVVITTGGLGPTEDDLTRKVVARVTGRRLVLHDETLQRITQRLEARRRRMTAEQTTQALIPRGAKVIPNPVGTAPGFFLSFKDEGKAERALMCLPGVAMEVQHIFPEGGSALLQEFVGPAARGTLLRRRLRTFGLVESEMDARLRDLYTAERSAVLDRAVVPYSDRAKVDLLKVSEALIRTKGAVSGEVAQAMAEGVRERSGADLGLAVTGIAGPTGGTKEKPVGLVYLALADKKTAVVRTQLFSGDRDGIRGRASQAALDLLRRYLSGKETG